MFLSAPMNCCQCKLCYQSFFFFFVTLHGALSLPVPACKSNGLHLKSFNTFFSFTNMFWTLPKVLWHFTFLYTLIAFPYYSLYTSSFQCFYINTYQFINLYQVRTLSESPFIMILPFHGETTMITCSSFSKRILTL